MKKYLILLFVLFTTLHVSAQKKEKTYKVLASCGTCNFNMSNESGCALAVQIANKPYWVSGSRLQDHGDEHDPKNGMCNNIRKAKVIGRLENDTLKTSSFTLLN